MKVLFFRRLFVGCLALAAASFAQSAGAQAMPPKVVYAVTYAAGPQWKPGLGPDKQDLAAHLTFVAKEFKSGQLVANGFYGDEVAGLYIFNARSEEALMQILRQDPGLRNGTITIASVAAWNVLIDNFDAPGSHFFVLDYRPGPTWNSEKTLSEQDLSHHLGYIGAGVKVGTVIAGGPVNDFQGRYIITAADASAAKTFTNQDPSVVSGLFRVEVRPWIPFNRQTIAKSEMKEKSGEQQ